MRRLELYFDLVCPYAYMGFHRGRAFAAEHGLELVCTPVLLGGIFKARQSPQVPMTTWSQARQLRLDEDLQDQAGSLGLPLSPPAGHPVKSLQAQRLILCAAPEQREDLIERLYAAYWQQSQDISQPAVLAPIAQAFGLSLEQTEQPAIKQALRENTERALERGVFGVPAFFLEGHEKLIWGQDRLFLLQQVLAGESRFRFAPATEKPKEVRTLRWYYDFSSPFAYLSSLRISELASAAEVRLEPVPILLGALFKSIGTPMIPLQTFPQAKQAWALQDLHDWAAWWGGGFRFTSHFPVHTVAALRVAIQAPEAIGPLFKAVWVDDQDVGDAEVLERVLSEAGFDAKALLAGTQDPAVKAVLRENTARAQALGVPGVPTFELPDGRLIWGQDRMDRVLHHLGCRD